MHDTERTARELQETIEAMCAEAPEVWEEVVRFYDQARAPEDKPPDFDLAITIFEERVDPSARKEVSEAFARIAQLLRAQARDAGRVPDE
jgi:hypothetical protein